MTRCLTAAVLAVALLAVVGVLVGFRRGREVPWAEEVPTVSLGGLVRFRWPDSVSEGVVKGIGWNSKDSMYIVHVRRVPPSYSEPEDGIQPADPWPDSLWTRP